MTREPYAPCHARLSRGHTDTHKQPRTMSSVPDTAVPWTCRHFSAFTHSNKPRTMFSVPCTTVPWTYRHLTAFTHIIEPRTMFSVLCTTVPWTSRHLFARINSLCHAHMSHGPSDTCLLGRMSSTHYAMQDRTSTEEPALIFICSLGTLPRKLSPSTPSTAHLSLSISAEKHA